MNALVREPFHSSPVKENIGGPDLMLSKRIIYPMSKGREENGSISLSILAILTR